MDGNTLSRFPAGLRPSAEARGRGWLQLVKPPLPAAGASFTHVVPGDYWERLLCVAFTLATSATTGARSVNFNHADGDGFVFNQTQVVQQLIQNSTVSEYGDLATTSPVQGETTLSANGIVTSPGANGAIATLSNPPAGTYFVSVTFELSGTVAAGVDNNNLQLYNGGLTQWEKLDNNIGTSEQTFGPFEITVNGATSIILASIAAGTVGSIYNGLLTAVPANNQGAFTIPDLIMKSGWQYQINVGNMQAADTLTNIGLLFERYPSSGQYLPGHDWIEQMYQLLESMRG